MAAGSVTSGRLPNPNSLTGKAWTELPRERTGPPPKWPLDKVNARHMQIWREEWRSPQAVMWEAQHQERVVALYVVALEIAERESSASNMTTVLRYIELLGISMPAMQRLRWRIAGQPFPNISAADVAAEAGRDGPSARERWQKLVKTPG